MNPPFMLHFQQLVQHWAGELPRDAAEALADLRAHTGLRMPDCCVLLTAELNSPADLATFDERLARVATERGITIRTGS